MAESVSYRKGPNSQWRSEGGQGGHMSPGAGMRGRQNRQEIINYHANVKSRTGTY